jgi:octaprenyl-diphosphate synthase
MSLDVNLAIETLADSASSVGDARLTDRLSHVQALLGGDLLWVENALLDASGLGTAPADSAIAHLVGQGGKRVRPTSVLLSAACFVEAPAVARELAVVVELIHTATLLHDDVIDEGMERRGAKTPRMLWGNAVSVLAGDTLLVHSLQRAHQHIPELMSELLSTLQRLVSGEIVQLRGRSKLDLSCNTYEQILNDKTASLFRFAISSGARLAGASVAAQSALGEFGERVGMAFQLVDDVLDYSGEDTGKLLGADLREGKVTLPLVLAVQDDPTLVGHIEAIRAGDDGRVQQLRELVVRSGSCDEVRLRARRETRLAVEALEAVPRGPARTLLAKVAEHLANRVK